MGLTKTQSGGLEDESVTLAKLPHGDGSSDGKFLRANNGADPTFETVSGTTINNNASTRIITGSNNANELDAESNLTVNGSLITFSSSTLIVDKSSNPTISAKETAGNKEVQLRASTTGGLLRTVGSYPLVIGTNQQERMRILAGGGLTFNGDTAAANALNDYEEGTFTPTARGHSTNSSPVISGSGTYIKIGKSVHVNLSFSAENGSYLPSGEYFQIHGLPFAASGTHFMGYGMNYKVEFNSSYQYYFYFPSGGTILWGYRNVNDSPYQPWGTNEWDSTQWYHNNTFTYKTT